MKNIVLCLIFALFLTACNSNKPQEAVNAIAAQKGNKLNEEVSIQNSKIQSEKEIKVDLLIGSYRCPKTKDAYVFYSNNTGQFFPGGKTPCSKFTWKRVDENVTITYEIYGEQKLKFNKRNRTITEQSPSLGTLIFNEE